MPGPPLKPPSFTPLMPESPTGYLTLLLHICLLYSTLSRPSLNFIWLYLDLYLNYRLTSATLPFTPLMPVLGLYLDFVWTLLGFSIFSTGVIWAYIWILYWTCFRKNHRGFTLLSELYLALSCLIFELYTNFQPSFSSLLCLYLDFTWIFYILHFGGLGSGIAFSLCKCFDFMHENLYLPGPLHCSGLLFALLSTC